MTESTDDKKQRVRKIIAALKRTYPDAECALVHANAFQLLSATILSAQCTDQRVNLVTPKLFERFPEPADLARGSLEEIEEIIQSTGFFRAKAKSLKGMATGLVEHHGGEVPQQLAALVQLPGVGRKTANVVLGTAFGIPSGLVVDTHVKRITALLGLTTHHDPEKVEQDLMQLVPRKEWIMFSHRLIHHGRQICIARRPRCTECPLLKLCPRVGLKPLPVT
ncbi:endonuclease III [Planctomicrobium sp. SH664]|uniref:endonuclease III n=1 Tax=Planctomicrobium sp. SH664 TaxID=3448125 RepID=UPI003F5C203E